MVRIVLVSPSPWSGETGNAVTARRWARILRHLGCRVTAAARYDGEPTDLVVALHAAKSAASVRRAYLEGVPSVVALTGTDLYRDLAQSEPARESLRTASKLVFLQPKGLEQVPGHYWSKSVVIHQSVRMPWVEASERPRHFDVAVLSHLREVKDPLRAALASRRLPPASRIRVVHAGDALETACARRAREEARRNPRYVWKGPLPRWRAKRLLAGSRLLVLSSRMEGGANVVSEACVATVPILATQIPGTVGILGSSYPGYFPVGDTAALAALMNRAETEPAFYATMRAWVRRLAPLFQPSHERGAWRHLLEELLG